MLMTDPTRALNSLLRQALPLLGVSGSSSSASELNRVFGSLCKLVLDEMIFREVWDESVLSQLNGLFQVKPPHLPMFEGQLAELSKCVQTVRRVNDLFYKILSHDASAEDVCQALAATADVEPRVHERIKSSDPLRRIRDGVFTPSEKVSAFLDFLRDDAGLDLYGDGPIHGCLEALRTREGIGVANALLVRRDSAGALVVPLRIKIESGSGQAASLVNSHPDFDVAIRRARHALAHLGFLKASEDMLYALDMTGAEYVGPSIALAAAAGAYSAARGLVLDPYTAFTGDINLGPENQWRIFGISGLHLKLKAARLAGCRRVFIPQENLSEVNQGGSSDVELVPVVNLHELFIKLHASLQPLVGDSLAIRKINTLRSLCQARGWALSEPRPIQNGVQFHVAPLDHPEVVTNIYNTGSHTLSEQHLPEYRELSAALQEHDAQRLPIQKVEQLFTIQEPILRKEIREALEKIVPHQRRDEPNCDYAFRFERDQEKLVVKQYQKGRLQIQGSAGELYRHVLSCIVPAYNLRYPQAQLSVEAYIRPIEPKGVVTDSKPPRLREIAEVPLPHIGTDESGKGDYFGPLVVAGILIDAATKLKLESIGVKDSKLLSDKRCRELAPQIRELCRGGFEEIEIPPERYNDLYESFQKEGKNLNHLLAWGHARAIENLLGRFPCDHAIADQFGDESYVLSKLMEKGKRINLIQLPKGERYTAVAAASILARDRFLARLDKLGQENGLELPKGASELVIPPAKRLVESKGLGALRKIAKLHHRTTSRIAK